MPSESFDLDTIPTTFLKKVPKHSLPSIPKICNLSLDTGEFCKRWKSTVVQSLIKAISNGTVETNNRPVSNLPVISKIIEKCTLSQLTTHSDMHNLLLEYQSAYRKFSSYEISLQKLINDTLWAMEQQQITAVLIMDLSAAFDTVIHDFLLDVLQRKFCITNYSTHMVQELPRTKKIQSMYQWLILVRMYHGLWLTPHIHSRCIPM